MSIIHRKHSIYIGVHHENTKNLFMYVYKRHHRHSHLDNSPKINLFELYGVFGLLHIIISENFYRHLIGDFRGFLFENVYHLCIEFIRCINFILDKSIYLWYLYISYYKGGKTIKKIFL